MKEPGDYKPNDEFVIAVRGLRFTMRFLGIWQQPDSRGWYNLVRYIHSVCFVIHLLAPAAGLVVNRHDPAKTIANLNLLTPATSILLKWVGFVMNSKTIEKLLHFMEEDWFNLGKDTLINKSVPDTKWIMKKHYQTARIFFITFLCMMLFGILGYFQDVLSSETGNSKNYTDNNCDDCFLIPYSWFPVDYSRGYTVQILIVSQTVTSTILSLASASIDNFFVTVTLHLCAQFRILRYFTESITYDPSGPELCKVKVEVMMRRHQELLRVAERIQKSYNFTIAVQYVSVSLSICFVGYAIIAEIEKVNPRTAVIIKTGCLLGALLQMIFVHCLVGDRLTNQSISIAMAIYNSTWYNSPRSICLSFMIVMARADRPVEITGAKLFPVSLESFTTLIKASASYISVLRAMGVTDG